MAFIQVIGCRNVYRDSQTNANIYNGKNTSSGKMAWKNGFRLSHEKFNSSLATEQNKKWSLELANDELQH